MARHAPWTSSDYELVTLPQNINTENNDSEIENELFKAKRRSLWQRLDLTSILALLLGSLILLLLLLALASVWKESIRAANGGEPKLPWVQIFVAAWTTRVLTICTAAIRVIFSFQASLVAAMLAGIILESIGTPLIQAPLYSVIRGLRVSPSKLISTTFLRPKDLLSFLVYTLVIIEVLVTIASQFLSTIFITDFADGTFANMNSSTDVHILTNLNTTETPWWRTAPAASWAFAELSEPFIKGPNFHDTGRTYRAFLPFDDQAQRTALRKFRGPAPVMDQRVVCAHPSLLNLILNSTFQSGLTLSGHIAIDTTTYPMFQDITETTKYVNFSCRLPMAAQMENATYGSTSLCLANSGYNLTVLLKDPLVEPVSYFARGYLSASTMMVIIDIVSSSSIIFGQGREHVVKSVRNDGPWAMVTNGSDIDALRVTACLTNLGSQTFTVDMDSSWEVQEPTMSWDRQAQKYNTETSRRQLGASLRSDSFDSRGILRLGSRSQWQDFNEITQAPSGIPSQWFFSLCLSPLVFGVDVNPELEFGLPYSDPVMLLSISTRDGVRNAYPAHVDIFQDTLNATGSPALATQAMLARIYQMAYYELLERLEPKFTSSTSFSTTASIPLRWAGFTAATAIIGTHLLIVIITIVLFSRFAKHSLIGNYWQTVSQIISEDSFPILERADEMKDEDIKEWAKDKSLNLKRDGVIRYRPDGRIAFKLKEEHVI